MSPRSALLVIALGALVACSSSGDGASSARSDSSSAVATDPVSTTESVSTTEQVSTTGQVSTNERVSTAERVSTTTMSVVTVGDWQSVPGGPDCTCGDGSPFEIWERPADPTKVMLYFEAGGACFSAEMCGPANPTSTQHLVLGQAPGLGGVFDETNPENPLADWSIVYVPYCTGDLHLGDAVTVYSDTVTTHHNGFHNAAEGLQTVVAEYPDVDQLLVAGSSAGSVPTPTFAGLAADALPDAEIFTFGDSSAAYPDVPALNAAVGHLWGVFENVPDWPVNEGLAPEDWSLPGLYVQSGLQHPDITFARFDFAYDGIQAKWAERVGIPADDLLGFVDRSEAGIEAEGVPIASYVAPGSQHTILGRDEFYEVEVEGIRLVDFLAALVGGSVPADVRCVECERPT